MPEQIKWTLTVQVRGGPKLSSADTIEVDAYDKIEAKVTAGEDTTVNVQPATGAQFLLVSATKYESLTYLVDAATKPVTLDGPHVLIGAGAVQLLGDSQNAFKFTNGGADDVTVSILVGRDATP